LTPLRFNSILKQCGANNVLPTVRSHTIAIQDREREFSKVWLVPGGRFLLTQEEKPGWGEERVVAFRLRDLGHSSEPVGSSAPIVSLELDVGFCHAEVMALYPTPDEQGFYVFVLTTANIDIPIDPYVFIDRTAVSLS
jgi:hypothetical protein